MQSALRSFKVWAGRAALGLAFVLSACATTGESPIDSRVAPPPPEGALSEEAAQAGAAETAPIVEKALESFTNKAVAADPEGPAAAGAAEAAKVGAEISHAKIPLELNADVERWIEYFTVKDADRFRRYLERGEKYKSIVTAVLKDQGIPTEIYYQALIESGFATHATSSAQAVGIWQFIRQTGRRYGLRVDAYVDERRDPMRATVAASLYLKDLHNVFQNWYLAMAAYNAGEGRILGAIMRAKTRDFWEMVRLRALPAETMQYIPKFLAATIIGHNPKRYGLDDLKVEMSPTLASVAIPSPVRLVDVAAATGIPVETIKEFNPHVLRGVTPPDVATYRIWVPRDQLALVENKLESLASLRLRGTKKIAEAAGPAPAASAESRYYKVRRGDTIAKVAADHRLTVAKLKSMNSLRSNRLAVGQKLIVDPGQVSAAVANLVRKYRVKNGDNLQTIARRFGMSLDELKKVNKIKRDRVYVGQVLKVGKNERG